MKKLNKKSFWMILVGLISSLICKMASTLQSRNSGFERLAERRNLSEDKLATLQRLGFGFNIIVTIIFAFIIMYFVFKLVKNKDTLQPQGYISFLYTVCTIFAVFNVLAILLRNLTAIIHLSVNILIIVGCNIQKNEEENQNQNID